MIAICFGMISVYCWYVCGLNLTFGSYDLVRIQVRAGLFRELLVCFGYGFVWLWLSVGIVLVSLWIGTGMFLYDVDVVLVRICNVW